MIADSQHILLIGFKHVGKSILGRALALRLDLPFYELDTVTEQRYAQRTGTAATCREIVQAHGEDYFRSLESEALVDVLKHPRGVVALGGGTPIRDVNQALIQAHFPIHITAPADIVRWRVMAAGWPQSADFDRIWNERLPVYQRLAKGTVDNAGDLDEVLNTILELLK